MSKLLAVLDTNILFSGLGWKGSPYTCLQMARAGRFTNVTCLEILTEFYEKLQSKMELTTAEAAKAIAEILSFSQLTTIENKLRAIVADPDDDKILECALAGRVNFIVSGDRHLLDLKDYQGIPILRADAFLEKILVR